MTSFKLRPVDFRVRVRVRPIGNSTVYSTSSHRNSNSKSQLDDYEPSCVSGVCMSIRQLNCVVVCVSAMQRSSSPPSSSADLSGARSSILPRSWRKSAPSSPAAAGTTTTTTTSTSSTDQCFWTPLVRHSHHPSTHVHITSDFSKQQVEQFACCFDLLLSTFNCGQAFSL